MSADAALEHIRSRATAAQADSERRWEVAVGPGSKMTLGVAARRFRDAGRVTLNFHPDRIAKGGITVAAGLSSEGRYRSQWSTGISSGSRSAMRGGERYRFERQLFGGAYDTAPGEGDFPVYGSFDLLFDPHGGSPRFGSSFIVLKRRVLDRTTLCVGDSHMDPRDVGTIDSPWSLLAGLAEQASTRALLNRGLGVRDLFRILDGQLRADGPSRDLDGYVEAQVHGGVSMHDDVEAVVLDPSFRGTDVEDDLAAAAGRYGFTLAWHEGSELHVDAVPHDFRGPTMPAVARRVARSDGVVDARAIGVAARPLDLEPVTPFGDPPDSEVQQLKYLWHTLLAHGHDAVGR